MAGRREKKIDPESPYAEFATDLRELRAAAGLTLDGLAQETGLSKSTLSAAANGRQLPSWDVVSVFVTACGAKPADWAMRWRRLSVGDQPGGEPSDAFVQLSRHGRTPTPIAAQTAEDFTDCLIQLRIWVGDESLRVIENKTVIINAAKRKEGAPGNYFLSRNTLHRTLQNKERLPTREFLEAFLTYCELSMQDRDYWIQAWQRIRHAEIKAKQEMAKTRKPKMSLAPEPKADGQGA
jgi:transcriptional regulator with XRE-family HTH domain